MFFDFAGPERRALVDKPFVRTRRIVRIRGWHELEAQRAPLGGVPRTSGIAEVCHVGRLPALPSVTVTDVTVCVRGTLFVSTSFQAGV